MEERLRALGENVSWQRPKSFLYYFLWIKWLEIFIESGNILGSGKQSTEKELHEKRINSKLGCFYAKEHQIPE